MTLSPDREVDSYKSESSALYFDSRGLDNSPTNITYSYYTQWSKGHRSLEENTQTQKLSTVKMHKLKINYNYQWTAETKLRQLCFVWLTRHRQWLLWDWYCCPDVAETASCESKYCVITASLRNKCAVLCFAVLKGCFEEPACDNKYGKYAGIVTL